MNYKKFFYVSLIIWIVFIGYHIHSATVQERNVNLKEVRFTLTEGDKIYIFDKGAKVRTYCDPPEKRKYYLKVAEGKIFTGVWKLKNK